MRRKQTKYDLNPAQSVIRALLAEMEIISYGEKEDAYRWLYAESQYFNICMDRPKVNIVPQYYYQPALPVYDLWKEEDKDIFHQQCEIIPLPQDEKSQTASMSQ